MSGQLLDGRQLRLAPTAIARGRLAPGRRDRHRLRCCARRLLARDRDRRRRVRHGRRSRPARARTVSRAGDGAGPSGSRPSWPRRWARSTSGSGTRPRRSSLLGLALLLAVSAPRLPGARRPDNQPAPRRGRDRRPRGALRRPRARARRDRAPPARRRRQRPPSACSRSASARGAIVAAAIPRRARRRVASSTRHGTDTLAPFALRPDKRIFLSDDGLSFLSYTTVAGVALVSGSPDRPGQQLRDADRRVRRRRAPARSRRRSARRARRRRSRSGAAAASAPTTRATRRSSTRRPSSSRAGRSARCASRSRGSTREGYRMQMRARSRPDRGTGRHDRRGSRTAGRAGAARPASRWPSRTRRPTRRATTCTRSRSRPDGEPHGFLHLADVAAGHALSLSAMRRLPRHAERPQRVPRRRDARLGTRARLPRASRSTSPRSPPCSIRPGRSTASRRSRRRAAASLLGPLPARAPARVQRQVRAALDRRATPSTRSTAALPRVALAAMLAEAYVALPWSGLGIGERSGIVTLDARPAARARLGRRARRRASCCSSTPSRARRSSSLRRPLDAARALAGARVWVLGIRRRARRLGPLPRRRLARPALARAGGLRRRDRAARAARGGLRPRAAEPARCCRRTARDRRPAAARERRSARLTPTSRTPRARAPSCSSAVVAARARGARRAPRDARRASASPPAACTGSATSPARRSSSRFPSHPGRCERARVAVAVRHARRAWRRLRPPPDALFSRAARSHRWLR